MIQISSMKNNAVKYWVASLMLVLFISLGALCAKLYEDQQSAQHESPSVNQFEMQNAASSMITTNTAVAF